ncbi:hypothetical protein L228DRAFT_246926 [Xylona heveae TC161]|uniref:Uncharacterized protein n=1 Tax=Xylona heveae (strain CBS 132557 / TC161) TaxID=1328760 RepID=A0A165GTX0_XYLHT|nr:hypothetical protein L228DRAFT_246926 [Xylona heveae TC161]KZF22594.1 hypothetical protein L228DRAFT_246926 [Xylona heveae TC161]
MASGEANWTQHEKKRLLAEIIKASSVAPDSLLSFIKENGLKPAWNQVALPGGRSVEDCQIIFRELLKQEHSTPLDSATRSVAKKRTLSVVEASTPAGRALQPRPPLSTASEPAARVGATKASEEGLPKRKRGRPSKADIQARAEAAAARGEPLPPTKTSKPKSTPSTPSATPGKRKRGRPSKADVLAKQLLLESAAAAENAEQEEEHLASKGSQNRKGYDDAQRKDEPGEEDPDRAGSEELDDEQQYPETPEDHQFDPDLSVNSEELH